MPEFINKMAIKNKPKHMRNLIAILSMLLTSLPIMSQKEYKSPQYGIIKQEIFDENSDYFYPNLVKKYLQGDSSLTIKHLRYLYYGFTFNPGFEPDKESRYRDQIMVYLRKEKLTDEELQKFISICEETLKDLPFDIRTLNILAFAYKMNNNIVMSDITTFKKDMILKAIESTGDGKTEKTAFHVIDRSHEYDLINEHGLRFATESNTQDPRVEYLLVTQNEKGIRGYYFDISVIFEARMR